jgi:hypothetical protein
LAEDARFITMINSNGTHFGQADNEFTTSLGDGRNAFVYLSANFSGTTAQSEYKTTTLRIQAFVQ